MSQLWASMGWMIRFSSSQTSPSYTRWVMREFARAGTVCGSSPAASVVRASTNTLRACAAGTAAGAARTFAAWARLGARRSGSAAEKPISDATNRRRFNKNGRSLDMARSLPSALRQGWIEGVTQAVSEQVEGQYRQRNRESREDGHPGG